MRDGLSVEMVAAGAGEALAQVVMMGELDPPITASLGPIDGLICRLRLLEGSEQTLPVGLRVNQIGKLREHLERFRKPLKNLSEMEETSFRAKWWMKEVRELCYDTEDYLVQPGAGVNRTLGRTVRFIISWIYSKLKWRTSTRVSRFIARAEVLKKTCQQIIHAEIEAAISLEEGIDAVISLEGETEAVMETLTAQLFDMLAFEDDKQPQLKVVIISGFTGSGKTKLARTLYVKCKRRFQYSAFVRVSRNPDFRSLLTSILSQIKAPSPHGLCDVHGLICSISDHLQGKRYFIVIDDVRSPSVWDIISCAFPAGNFRSRILVTTQSEQVEAAYSGYMLKSAIFKMGATDDGCTHTSTKEYSKALNIRYNNLPLHLKTCLLYLGMHPEGCTIRKDDLVKQWVAEVFIPVVKTEETSQIPQNKEEAILEISQNETEEIGEVSQEGISEIIQDQPEQIAQDNQDQREEIARGYFDELVTRGMIQPVDINHKGEILSCTVHHLVLDLIKYKSKEDNFLVVVDNLESTLGHPDIVRRLSVQFGCEKGASIPESIILSQVRSLTFYGFLGCVPSFVDYGLLRVLNLHIWADEDKIFDLTRIGELYYLRYLKIECNITVRLPLKIQRLQHLGTLELHAQVVSIPLDIGHLKKLLHVRCPCKADVWDLSELTNLLDLQLTCYAVENLEDNMKCIQSVLEKLSSLRSLVLVPASGACSVNTLPVIPLRMCIVYPTPAHLQRLELSRRCCIFSTLPEWIGELHELCVLKIAVRELSREDIEILKGLPALTTISLHLATMAAEMIVFGKGGFSLLTHFKITCNVPWLKFEADAMRNLEKLKLRFNSLTEDERGTIPIIIIERLSGLKEISAIIDSAGADAGSAWWKAIRNDRGNPKVQLVGSIYYDDQGRETVTREGSAEVESNEADIRIHTKPESSHLPAPAWCREDEPEDRPFRSEIISIPNESESTDGHISSQVVMHGKQTGSSGPGRAHGGCDGHLGGGGGLSQGGGGAHDSGSSLGTKGGVKAEAAPPSPSVPLRGAQLVESPQALVALGSTGLGSTPPAVNTHTSGFTDREKTVQNISTRMGDVNQLEHVLHRHLAKDMVGGMVSVVTGVMNPLIRKLTVLMGDEYKKLKGVRKQASFLKDELSAMNVALHKMELMDELDSMSKNWVDHAREYSYDMENCIDDFMSQFEREGAKAGFIKKTTQHLKRLRSRHQIANRIKELSTLAQEANARRERYKIDDCFVSDVALDPRLQTAYKEAASLVGIDGPMAELANLLVDTQKNLKVLSIVGFGGLGKTTLALQLYNKFRGQFHCEAFFSVSQKPDIKVLLNLLEAKFHMTQSSRGREIEDIIQDIREHLKEKRYLIVVDDLWDQSLWNIISCAFPNERNGSRVIVTTRIESVASTASHNDWECIYRMKPLNEHNSRMLFFRRVFGSDDVCPPSLKDVSADILKKCGGLPLAIITIASLLASIEGSSRSGWENIKSSLGAQSTIHPTLEDMKKILNLSYMHLPLHLRPCFLYLGMYAENEEIWMSDVIREWVAEGLVSNLHGADLMDVGKCYFNELINRSMIQPGRTEKGELVSCRVNDVMLDLILSKCAEYNFLSVASSSEDITRLQACEYKVRRLSLRSMAGGATNGLTIGPNFLSQVRSCTWARNSMPPLLLFKYLRVLTLEGDYYGVTIDLTFINQLFQLRYLRVLATDGGIELPCAIKGLAYLETLDLTGFLKNSFPSDIVQLPCLSYLRLPDGAPAIQGVGNMRSLRTLLWFDLEKNVEKDIRGLGELINLRELQLCGRVETSNIYALASSIGKLRNLKHLDTGTAAVTDQSNQLGLLSGSPFKQIEILMLETWEFPRVPKWMGDLHILRYLNLRALETSTEDVHVLGKLPSLVCLNFSVIKIDAEPAVFGKGVFPVLEQFQFWSSNGDVMAFLVFEEGAMPKLQTLKLNVNAWGGSTPVGMEHLILLERIRLYASPDAKFLLSSWTKDDLVCAIRKASQLHPNRPSFVVISFAGSKF